jgi:hypothetical protein
MQNNLQDDHGGRPFCLPQSLTRTHHKLIMLKGKDYPEKTRTKSSSDQKPNSLPG